MRTISRTEAGRNFGYANYNGKTAGRQSTKIKAPRMQLIVEPIV